MTLDQRIKAVFDTIERSWDAVPGPVKVFIYSTSSMIASGWVNGNLDGRFVVTAILINIGLYQVPRTTGTAIKKAL